MKLTQEQMDQMISKNSLKLFLIDCIVCGIRLYVKNKKTIYCSPSCACIAYRARLSEKRATQSYIEAISIMKNNPPSIQEKIAESEITESLEVASKLETGNPPQEIVPSGEDPDEILKNEIGKEITNSKRSLYDVIYARKSKN